MTFPFDIYGGALLAAAVVAAVSIPFWRRWCLRVGLLDDPGHRKIHSQPVALAGGLAVLTGIVAPVLVGAMALAFRDGGGIPGIQQSTGELFQYGLGRRALQVAAILAGALGMTLVGLYDDRRELRPGPKFAAQVLVAALVAASGLRITVFIHNVPVNWMLTILWIVTVTNATNFMDNMNGLCAGLGVIGAWCFAWSAAVQGQFLSASACFLMCGALAGFLPFNFPRASAFLGDSGSHLVGYLLAVMGILPSFYASDQSSHLAILKPLLILGMILGDLVCVVWIRWRAGRPVYLGDTNHLSHRLVRRGWSRTQAVLGIWLAAAFLGWLSFIAL